MSGVEIRQIAALKGQGGSRKGQEEWSTLSLGLAGVLSFPGV